MCLNRLRASGFGNAERLVRDCTYKTNLRKRHRRLSRNQTFKSILSAAKALAIYTRYTAVSSKSLTERSRGIQITGNQHSKVHRWPHSLFLHLYFQPHTRVSKYFLVHSFLFFYLLSSGKIPHSSVPLRSCQKWKYIIYLVSFSFFGNNFH